MKTPSFFMLIFLCSIAIPVVAADERKYDPEQTRMLQAVLDSTGKGSWKNQRGWMLQLIDAKADPNITRRRFSDTPLLAEAALHDDKKMVTFCVEHGAAVNNDGPVSDHKPLFCAQSSVVARFLIMNKANVHDLDHEGNTLLHDAVIRGKDTLLLRLFSGYGLASQRDREGNTPLHVQLLMADRYSDNDLAFRACILIDGGADLDAENVRMQTPLALLSSKRFYVESRVRAFNHRKHKGPGVRYWKKGSFDPLRTAQLREYLAWNFGDDWSTEQRPRIVTLLELGADPKKTKCLDSACTHNDVELARLALSYGADPDEKDDDDMLGSLESCVWDARSVEMIDLLAEYNADVRSVNRFGWTVLHNAIKGHQGSEFIRAYLAAGADPNKKDKDDKSTPLSTLCRRGIINDDHLKIAAYLLYAKANITIPAYDGKAPLEYLESHWQNQIATQLRTLDCDVQQELLLQRRELRHVLRTAFKTSRARKEMGPADAIFAYVGSTTPILDSERAEKLVQKAKACRLDH